jgi:hypothetical protein
MITYNMCVLLPLHVVILFELCVMRRLFEKYLKQDMESDIVTSLMFLGSTPALRRILDLCWSIVQLEISLWYAVGIAFVATHTSAQLLSAARSFYH